MQKNTPWPKTQNIPVGQHSYEGIGEELDGGFGGEEQAHLHILVQEVLVLAGTVRGRSGGVGHRVLRGGRP